MEQAVGKRALHDMTLILHGKEKGPAFKCGQIIEVGDICRLQKMGRQTLYVEEGGCNVAHYFDIRFSQSFDVLQ